MTIQIFVEVEAGSFEKRRYDEKTLEYKGMRSITQPYPFPYGFIMKTETEDGDGMDAYVITQDQLKAGQIFECEPVGMLEVFEGDEIDNKVLACRAGQIVEIDDKLIELLQDFIYKIWKNVPTVKIRVGRLLSKQETMEYIARHTID